MATQQNHTVDDAGPDTPVWKLMTRAMAKIAPDARLDELAHKLVSVGVGAMGVGSTDSLSGIVSERDLTRALGTGGEMAALTVGDITSDTIIWCDGHATAAAAARLMVDRGVRHLIVGDPDRDDVEGIVSARDLIEALIGD